MIKVFKCDHCIHFTQDAEEMRTHEEKCKWNESNKTCFSCEHSGFDAEDNPTCDLNVKIGDRINKNCSKWE